MKTHKLFLGMCWIIGWVAIAVGVEYADQGFGKALALLGLGAVATVVGAWAWKAVDV